MKRHFVILIVALILIGPLAFVSVGQAQVQKGGKWKQKKDMPTPRGDVVAVVFNNLIFAMGGRDGRIQERYATVEIYNPPLDTWKKGTDMPTAREQFSANTVDGKIYVFGGYTTVERRGKKIIKSLGTLEVYDPAADAWEQKANMLVARTIISSTVLDNKIYVMGGQDNVGGGTKRVDIYDPATDT